MIEINHRFTAEILHWVYTSTLEKADLRGLDLRGADFEGVNLRGADLSNTDLTEADLAGADLRGANLTGATLTGAELNKAHLGATLLNGVSTLSEAKGLERVQHDGPSQLDQKTLESCIANLPDVFLIGVGYTAQEIEKR